MWNGFEPAWSPSLVDESHVVLSLSQGRRTDDNIRLRNIAARVEFPDEVLCRFDTQIRVASPQLFGFDKAVGQVATMATSSVLLASSSSTADAASCGRTPSPGSTRKEKMDRSC
jgi:hypothetical protein